MALIDDSEVAMSSQAHKQESLSAAEPASERIPRMLIIGILGAIPAGLVGGVGGRLIMRILAMVNEENAGIMTENGNISGEITAIGTLGLIIGVGLVSGVIGGLVYVMIRRWLPDRGLLKGVTFGLVLLCFSGIAPIPLAPLLDPDNVDLALFGPRQLAVGLFALLFLLYGVVASLVVEGYDRYVPPLFTRSSITVLRYLLIAGLCAFGLSRTVPAINAIV